MHHGTELSPAMTSAISHSPTPHVLVTGGAGFIGSHLVERLLADGQVVVVVDDLSTGTRDNLRAVLEHKKLRVIQSKLSACAELPELVRRAKAIYHLAAVVGVQLVLEAPLHTVETNLLETQVLLKIAAAHRVPLLLTSSSEVYGKSEKAELSETDDLLLGPPDCSRWGYAYSKLTDEFLTLAYARERSLPAVIARLFNVVGPRQTGRYGMVLPRFIESAKRGQPLKVFGDGQQQRCFSYVGDTVEALIRLQDCPAARGQVFNVGSTAEVSVVELARSVIQFLGSTSGIEFVPYNQAYAQAVDDPRHRKPAVEKLAAAIGFRPMTSLRDIILKTAASIP
jgi:UDP-glucose 4-epimerase